MMCESYIMPSTVTGQPHKAVENITFSNIYLTLPGGCGKDYKNISVPEITKSYPENYAFGEKFPTFGIFFRHIKNLKLSNVNIETLKADARDTYYFEDIKTAETE